MENTSFQLWLEFEVGQGWAGDPYNDFFNMHVVLANGQVYALNVWTFGYLETARAEARASGEYLGGAFMPAPDLFVEDLNRTHLEAVVADLIATGGLRGEWLVEKDDDDGK